MVRLSTKEMIHYLPYVKPTRQFEWTKNKLSGAITYKNYKDMLFYLPRQPLPVNN
jgi:hypothetical protein